MSQLPWKIALRYLFVRKSHSAVNLISLVAVCCVCVAATALVCVLSVFNGFSSVVHGKLSVIDPHIVVQPVRGNVIGQVDSLTSVIGKINGVKLVMPTISGQALARRGDRQMPVLVKGVPDDYDSLVPIRGIVKDDGDFVLNDGFFDYAVISVGTALTLDTRPGYREPLSIYVPKRKGRVNVANPMGAFRADTMWVSGVFQTDQLEYDANTVLLPVEAVRRLFDYPGQSTAIEVALVDGADEKNVMRDMRQALGDRYEVKDRLMQHDASFRLINIEKWITFLLLAFILLIAAFNIISTVSVLIVEKDSDISTLRNLGASRSLVSKVFSAQAFLITMAGTATGMILGVLLCLVQQHFGVIKLAGDPGMLVIDAYPVVLVWSDLLVVAALSVAVAMLASAVTAAIMRQHLKNR